MPITVGSGGRLAQPANSTAKYYREQSDKLQNNSNSLDIREKLLRHEAEVGEESEFTKIYRK